ncbi:MAG: 3-hydroxyacyl-CoA dehydrogenase [Magnetovibrio sp.]|nr:3-hydroxyacyl-CoA dehydrogenase [Magnetovibrio sp.]MBR83282.1 3-hydroxyacyl-CoA dehydrogenase [Magnetovibrio sp.]|tara:strand:- start:2601 stop:3362 length:762 start_codon:yes stop_codon:yes gene_type:complete
MDINGLAAVITGAASGLGEATARALSGGGAKVAILDRNEERAKAVGDDLGGVGIGCDVADATSMEAAIQTAAETHGPARIVVNCAGVGPAARVIGRDGPMDLQKFAQVITINLVGTFNTLRLAAAAMQELDALETGERGIIINTASVAAFEGQIGQAAYSASKGGVHAMTIPVARELARFGIRVLTIAPGIMSTPMLFALPDEVQESLGKTVPFPARLGSADEYAKLVLHMCDNVYMNGETVRLDGGIRLTAG